MVRLNSALLALPLAGCMNWEFNWVVQNPKPEAWDPCEDALEAPEGFAERLDEVLNFEEKADFCGVFLEEVDRAYCVGRSNELRFAYERARADTLSNDCISVNFADLDYEDGRWGRSMHFYSQDLGGSIYPNIRFGYSASEESIRVVWSAFYAPEVDSPEMDFMWDFNVNEERGTLGMGAGNDVTEEDDYISDSCGEECLPLGVLLREQAQDLDELMEDFDLELPRHQVFLPE